MAGRVDTQNNGGNGSRSLKFEGDVIHEHMLTMAMADGGRRSAVGIIISFISIV